MANFIDELRKYFETTSLEKIQSDWEKYEGEEYDVGPTAEEFLAYCSAYYQFTIPETPQNCSVSPSDNNNISSEFASGFFLAYF